LKTIFDNPADDSKKFVPRRCDGTIIVEPLRSAILLFSAELKPLVTDALKAAAGSEMKSKDVTAKIAELWESADAETKGKFSEKLRILEEAYEKEVAKNEENETALKDWESEHPEIVAKKRARLGEGGNLVASPNFVLPEGWRCEVVKTGERAKRAASEEKTKSPNHGSRFHIDASADVACFEPFFNNNHSTKRCA